MITFKSFLEMYDNMLDAKRPRKKPVRRKFKIGHVVKINKPGHPWNGKLGNVLKSKTIKASNASEYAVGIKGSNQSDRFTEDELGYTNLGYDDFVAGAKRKEPRAARGRGK